MTDQWEYRWDVMNSGHVDASQKSLNLAGAKGWEAIGLAQQFTTTWILLKRRLPEGAAMKIQRMTK